MRVIKMFDKKKIKPICCGYYYVHKYQPQKIQINKNVESLWIFCEKCGDTKRLS